MVDTNVLPYVSGMVAPRFDKLTEAQRDCLRRVLRHQTSKDIARELQISPHTVDQRLRVAARTLGVAGRIEAARLLARYEGEGEGDGSGLYQPLAYQSSAIDSGGSASANGWVAAGDPNARPSHEAGYAREYQMAYQAFVPEPHIKIALPLPIPAQSGDENKLGGLQRVGWMVAIAIASALSFGAILAGLASLGSLMRGG